MPQHQSLYVTPKWLAERLNVTPGTVVRWCASGRIPATRTPGNQWRILRSVAERLLDPSDVPRRAVADAAREGVPACRTTEEEKEVLRRAGIG